MGQYIEQAVYTDFHDGNKLSDWKKWLRVLIQLNELASIIVFQWRPRKAMLRKVKEVVNLIILLILDLKNTL